MQDILKKKNYPTAIGDEGGFAPKVASNEEPLELITRAIEQAGNPPGKDIGISLDPRSSGFLHDGKDELNARERPSLLKSRLPITANWKASIPSYL